MTETQVFTDIIVPAFAVVGVAQYWLIALYRKIVKRQKLEVIRAGVVEATFSVLGPMVSLLGTIVSFNRDAIISKIDLVLPKERAIGPASSNGLLSDQRTST